MSRQQPQRPSAPSAQRRPGAAPAVTPGATTVRKGGPSPEEIERLRALPTTEDTGISADVDPEKASAGRIVNETVTISGAEFFTMTWQRKDGSFPENAVPKCYMRLFFKREGDGPNDKPYRHESEYGSSSVFVPSKDGQFVNVRKSVIKEGGSIPVPRKQAEAVRFLTTLKAKAGQSLIDQIKKDGIGKALSGLRVHVSQQKTPDMSELAKGILLVDFIEGAAENQAPVAPQAPANTSATTATAPAAQAPAAPQAEVNSDIQGLAESALADVLSHAGGTIQRAQIPTTLIKLEKWVGHANRGAILKELRSDVFINDTNRNGVLWAVDGTAVKLLD